MREIVLRRRRIPEEALHRVVGEADRIIGRDDGRTEYFGVWQRRTLLVVTEGDSEPLRVVTVVDIGRRSGR